MTPKPWWVIGLINIVAFVLIALDKQYARRHRRRIPEATLLSVAAFGGAPLTLLAMYLFHHKTRKPKFYIGVPCLLILQLAIPLLVYLYI